MVIPKPLAHHAISVSHDDQVIDQIIAAMDKALEKVAQSKQ